MKINYEILYGGYDKNGKWNTEESVYFKSKKELLNEYCYTGMEVKNGIEYPVIDIDEELVGIEVKESSGKTIVTYKIMEDEMEENHEYT